MPDDIDRIADELYEADPSEFVTARTAHVAAAKKAGNRALAKDIGALRKPTTVAWLVNLLVREERDETDALFALGEELRDAQRKSSASRMRDLGARRQSLIRQLSRRAVELGAEYGRDVAEDAGREIGQTLHAALADPEIADRVRAGRIVTAENYSGFGPASLSLAAQPTEAPESDPEADVGDTDDEEPDEPDDAALEAAREALTAAREALDSATDDESATRSDFDAAEEEKASATTRLADAKARLKQLRQELHDAEAEELDARAAERAAAKEAQARRRAWEAAGARTAEAQRELDELD